MAVASGCNSGVDKQFLSRELEEIDKQVTVGVAIDAISDVEVSIDLGSDTSGGILGSTSAAPSAPEEMAAAPW